ncbi:MAG TPA: hypothetical protein ENK55_10870 [Actinobacteria bacterium]|nr:hypothetical protein [Actinomycetota bacterium]
MSGIRGISRELAAVLAGVVAAAREELRSMDDDEVPTRLAKVARDASRRLPPPLVRLLLDVLDEDAELRARVAEAWDRRGETDPVGRAFLHREAGWWSVVAEAVAERRGEAHREALDEAGRRIERLEEQVEEGKRRLAEARRRLQEMEEAHREEVRQATAETRSASVAQRRRAEHLEEQVSRLEAEREALRAEADEQARRMERLEADLRAARAQRRTRPVQASAPATVPIPKAPRELARLLDRLATVAAPYRVDEPLTTDVAAAPASPSLPPGVAPDRPEAVEALAAAPPDRVLVDGHNVLGAGGERELTVPEARERLVVRLGRLARRYDRPVLVVFDSSIDGRDATVGPGPVEVRFSPADASADDVIAAEAGPGDVVISNDRDLRERAEERGALVLWADALVAWLEGR